MNVNILHDWKGKWESHSTGKIRRAKWKTQKIRNFWNSPSCFNLFYTSNYKSWKAVISRPWALHADTHRNAEFCCHFSLLPTELLQPLAQPAEFIWCYRWRWMLHSVLVHRTRSLFFFFLLQTFMCTSRLCSHDLVGIKLSQFMLQTLTSGLCRCCGDASRLRGSWWLHAAAALSYPLTCTHRLQCLEDCLWSHIHL